MDIGCFIVFINIMLIIFLIIMVDGWIRISPEQDVLKGYRLRKDAIARAV